MHLLSEIFLLLQHGGNLSADIFFILVELSFDLCLELLDTLCDCDIILFDLVVHLIAYGLLNLHLASRLQHPDLIPIVSDRLL